MDASFPDLYGLVSLKPSSEVLTARWTAVASLSQVTTRTQILNLVRVSAAVPGADASVVVEAARRADPSFQSLNSDAELRVLASAALLELCKESSNAADAAALATTTLALTGLRSDELSHNIQRAAKHYLMEEAVRVRESRANSLEVTAEERAVAIQAYQAAAAPHGQNPSAVGEPLANLIKQLTAQQDAAVKQLRGEIKSLREECNMSWWVLSEYSQDLQQRFADVGVSASCLVAARELAQMTILLPGPRSAAALLDRVLAAAGVDRGNLTIPEVVNATPRDWRQEWLREAAPDAARDLTPILLAVEQSLHTDSATDWISAFEKNTGLSALRLAPPVLALQAYTETLLVRAMTALPLD